MTSTLKAAAMHVGKITSKLGLPHWLLLAALVGLAIGNAAPSLALPLQPAKGLLLNGIELILAPLAFALLISRIAQSSISSDLVRARATRLLQAAAHAALLLGLGVAEALTVGQVAQLLILATLMGFAVRSIGKSGEPLVRLSLSVLEATLRFARYLMVLAPLAVLMTVAESGLNSLLMIALTLFAIAAALPVLKLAQSPLLEREMSRAEAASALALAATSALAPSLGAAKPAKLHAAAIVPVPLTWEMPAAVTSGPRTTYAYDDGQAVS